MLSMLNLTADEKIELLGMLMETDEKEYPQLVMDYMMEKEFKDLKE